MLKLNAIVYRNSLSRERGEDGKPVTVISVEFSQSEVTLLFIDKDGTAGTAPAHSCCILLDDAPATASRDANALQTELDLALDKLAALNADYTKLEKQLAERDEKLAALVDTASEAKANSKPKVVKPAKAK